MRIVTDAIPKEVIEEARSYVMKNMGDWGLVGCLM